MFWRNQRPQTRNFREILPNQLVDQASFASLILRVFRVGNKRIKIP